MFSAMYHVSVHELAERVLAHIRREELLRAGDRLGVAVSGGIDSVGLLRLLLELRTELGIVLSIVHFNHKLRGPESDADQQFVADLAREHELEFYCASGDTAEQAVHEHSGLEAAARELRYGFFSRLLGSGGSEESSPSGVEAQNLEALGRSAGSAAAPKGSPRELKPASGDRVIGTAEAMPFPNPFPTKAGLSSLEGQSPKSFLDKIATGHTLDDQAETVLMRLIRGTGLRGLAGIYPRILIEHENGEGHGEIVRPLLGMRRRELERYLIELKQPWREDVSNSDTKFTRNRVRKLVLPLLEREFNPAVAEGFSELAEIARDEEDYWENEISGWIGTVVQWSEPEWSLARAGFDAAQALVQIQPSSLVPNPELTERIEPASLAAMNASVSRPWFLTEPKAVQRRVLKAIGEHAGIPLEFKHVEEILRFAAEDGPSGKRLSLPLGWKLLREPEALVFETPDMHRQERTPDYEYSLPVPGRAAIPELGVVIEALLVSPESQLAEYNRQQLIRAELLPGRLLVRNWRAGDRFWPAHTKAPKKVKELLQDKHERQPKRRLWPAVVSGDEIVWMRGFPVPARLRAPVNEEAVLIREVTEENEI